MVRQKNRYLVTEYEFVGQTATLTKQLLIYLIEEQVLILHGEHGLGLIKFGFCIKYFNPNTHIVVIRLRHRVYKYASSAIPFIRGPVQLKLLRVTATILHAFKFIRTYQIKELERAWKDRMFTKNLTPTCQTRLNALKDVSFFTSVIEQK